MKPSPSTLGGAQLSFWAAPLVQVAGRPFLRVFASSLFLCGLSSAGTGATAAAVEAAGCDYLGDTPELVISHTQAWGELGRNVAAHAGDQPGAPLQIGTETYASGLGHHANGSITLALDGQYSAFDAEVGVQPCEGGSVIFQVLVDGEKGFDSGVMRSKEEAKPVHVDVTDARELVLEAKDAGDGITCDMANWANARLTRARVVSTQRMDEDAVDVGRFARVVTWDPERMDGARANRIQEFLAEDLFTDTAVPRQVDGTYRVPASQSGEACIGLQWLNRRALKTLGLEFADAASVPPTNAVQVQGWFGESAWQGGWKRLAGEVSVSGNRMVFRLAPKAGFAQTQKVRWIWQTSGAVQLKNLTAFTRSAWRTVPLHLEYDKAARGAAGEVNILNGELASAAKDGERATHFTWKLSRPLQLAVRASRPSSFKSDPTILQFRLPMGACAVAVEDVLTNGCVYLPDYGLFVTREPAPIRLADYKRQITGRKTILQQVREMPDQTLAQAMARTHHEAQREGPVMLSLACDNHKFVLERDGLLRFQITTNLTRDWFATAGAIQPQFGVGPPTNLTRRLDGGWLPIPVITAENNGLLYSERVFVAPFDEAGNSPSRLNRRSICVAEFTITNALDLPAKASLSLNFLADSRQKKPASLTPCAGACIVADDTGPFALAAMLSSALKVVLEGSTHKVHGTLPPHRSASFAVFLPAQRTALLELPDLARLRADTEVYWKAVLAPAMQVETPDPLLNDLIRSSQVRCLIAARNEADGARIAPWIAAMSYGPLESEANSVIRGMDFMGHAEFARRGLDFFIHRYNTNGFLTTGYTTFGTAWHLWTLGEHYQLYRDTNWLRQVAPEVERVAAWVVRQTEKTKRSAAVLSGSANESSPAVQASTSTLEHPKPASAEDSRAPEYGLMPPGVMADWNSFAFHYALNAYYYAALRAVGLALSDLSAPHSSRREVGRAVPGAPGQDEGAPQASGALGTARPTVLLTQAERLRESILAAYHWTQSQAPALRLRNGTWVPHYPSQVHSPGKLADFFPGQDAGRSWCYDVEIGAHQLVPTGVFDPHDREVERMLDHMEDVQFLADGWFDYPAAMNEKDWFNLGGFSKVQPYYTRNCEVYALRDDVKPFIRSYFNTIAAMLNPEVMTFWEHFHHSGAWDKTHETGYFLHQTRTMLVMERGKELWLAPFITSNWLKDGMVVAVTNAPTRFGPVSFRIISHVSEGYIAAILEAPTPRPPAEVTLRLRHPEGKGIKRVTIDGVRSQPTARDAIAIKPAIGPVFIRVEY
jgi:hypothetical protein